MPAQPLPRDADNHVTLITTPVQALIRRPPVTLPPHTTIQAAAQVMCEHRVSSVVIVQDGVLFGLITDRDLRNRVIAAGLDTSRPIMEIATLAPMTIDLQSPAFDALLMMARHNIHHVPVMDQGTVVGSVDLSGSTPRLRRPDPATPLGRAVTEAALALVLVWEP